MTTLFDFMASEPVARVESMFGLNGYARIVKVVSMLLQSDRPVVTFPVSDWERLLSCKKGLLAEWFTLCDSAGVFQVHDENGRLRVSCPFLDQLNPCNAPVLFTDPEQWAVWFIRELNYDRQAVSYPYAVAMFRRWCVSRVTECEMLEAVQQVSRARRPDLSIKALHEQLQAMRKQKLQEIPAC